MPPQLPARAVPDDTGNKRERTKLANREAILDAARKVFAELGFEATTVRDIVRGTDLASGTFYNYFKSKEEVFDALATSSVGQFRPYLNNIRQTAESLEDYFLGAYAAFFRFLINSQEDEIAVITATRPRQLGLRVDTPDMQAIFREIRDDIDDYLSRRGQPRIDTEYLTAAAIGIARELGDCMLARKSDNQEQLIEETAKFATNLVLNGAKSQFGID